MATNSGIIRFFPCVFSGQRAAVSQGMRQLIAGVIVVSALLLASLSLVANAAPKNETNPENLPATEPKASKLEVLLQSLPDAWLYEASGLVLKPQVKPQATTHVTTHVTRWVSLDALLTAATEQGARQPKSFNLQTGALATSLWPTWDSAVKEWLELAVSGGGGKGKTLPEPLQEALSEQLHLMAEQKALRDYYGWIKALLQADLARHQVSFEAQKLAALYYEVTQGKELSLKLLSARSWVLEQQSKALQAEQAAQLSELSVESWLQNSLVSGQPLQPVWLQAPPSLMPVLSTAASEPNKPLPASYPQSWQQAVLRAKEHRPEWQLMRWLQSPKGGLSPAVSFLFISKRLPPLPLNDLEAQLKSSTEALAQQNWLAAEAAHEQWQLAFSQWQLALVQAQQTKSCLSTGLCNVNQQEASKVWLKLTELKAQLALADLEQKRLELAAFCGQLYLFK